jgi:hypothetical protein
VIKNVIPSLVFLPTSSTTRILLLRAKPRVPPKRKDVEPGSVKVSPVAKGEGRTAGYQASHVFRCSFQGEAMGYNSLVALVGEQVPGIALPCYFPKSADCLNWANGDVIGDNS